MKFILYLIVPIITTVSGQYLLVPVMDPPVVWPQQYLQAINSPSYIVHYQDFFQNIGNHASHSTNESANPEEFWEDDFADTQNLNDNFNDPVNAFEPEMITGTKICSNACFCGARFRRRIVGGTPSEAHEFPWLTLLEYSEKFYCGGTLINNRYVLTAGHCLEGFSMARITVRFLEHDRSIKNDTPDFARTVDQMKIHPRYNAGNFNNDIGLLRIANPLEFASQNILRPSCLPSKGADFSGYVAVAAGWGTTSEGGATSNVVRKVSVPIINQAHCRRNTNYGNAVTEQMMCAGFLTGVKDACQGDSGGPLMLVHKKRFRTIGITSWGDGCARARRPGIYTRVPKFIDWIVENTKDGCYCS